MKTGILIVKEKQQDIFKEFFEENAVTEIVMMRAKSVKRNFLLNFFNLTDEAKTLFLFNTKDLYMKKLEELCKENLGEKDHGILIKIKKESTMKEKEENKKVKNDKLIVVILKSGFTELVIDAAKEYEVSGATILSGKGIGAQHSTFMGMGIDSEREVVLIAVSNAVEKKLQMSIKKALIKNQPVNGISFSLPLEDFIKYNEGK